MNSSRSKDRITVIGIGAMGAPIALRLLDAGFDVSVWNRTQSKAEPLAAHGAIVFSEASEAVRSADVVVTILETGDAVESVLFGRGVADALVPGACVIDMSSITPNTARDHALRLGGLGFDYLDAPVSGGTRGASEGTLAIMVGGDPTVFARWREFLSVLGVPALVGPSGSGQVTKLANQMIVGVTIAAVAEALALIQVAGVDSTAAFGALAGGFADSRVLREHGPRMIASDFEPGAASRIQLKDLVNALGLATEMGLELPITSITHSLYESLCAAGRAELDHSALFLQITSDP